MQIMVIFLTFIRSDRGNGLSTRAARDGSDVRQDMRHDPTGSTSNTPPGEHIRSVTMSSAYGRRRKDISFFTKTSGGSRISPRRGRQLSRGCQHTILPNFPQNCMKLKEFGPRGGRASKILLCRSATEDMLMTY